MGAEVDEREAETLAKGRKNLEEHVSKEQSDEKAPVPAPDWTDIHGLSQSSLDVLVELANGLEDEIRARTGERADIMEQIRAAMQFAMAEQVRVGACGVFQYPANPMGTSSLKKELLIQQGVTPEQIKKATVETPRKGFAKITRPGV